jgi:hybrid cluster-associated redox disulfide protein
LRKYEKEKTIMEITKQTTMGEMLQYDGGIAYILMQSGMHCVGCPSSIGESLEEACMVHGLDADVVLKSIQDYLASKDQK